MNILFQYFSGGGGGLANIMLLLKAFSRRYPFDHLDIICSKSSDLRVLGTLKNVDIHIFGGYGHREIDRLLLGIRGINRIAKTLASDIIWSMNLGPYLKTVVPHILSVNNSYQVYPREVHRYHPDNYLNVALLRWFFLKTLSVSDGVIVQTPLMGQYIRQLQFAPASIAVVPKAVEDYKDIVPIPLTNSLLEIFESGIGSRAFTFLFASTYNPHKNHITLINAFDALASKGRNIRVAVTINLDDLVAIGGKKAMSLLDSGHILALGWFDKCHLKSLYEMCDACLMPSVLESLSSAHLEAMRWGKPQITADLPYARDLCADAAVFVEAENSQAWANAIEEFVDDPVLRKNLVLLGYERMKQFPQAWEEVAVKTHDFIEEIANRN